MRLKFATIVRINQLSNGVNLWLKILQVSSAVQESPSRRRHSLWRRSTPKTSPLKGEGFLSVFICGERFLLWLSFMPFSFVFFQHDSQILYKALV